MLLFHSNNALCADTIPPYTVDTPTPPQPTFQYGGSYLCSAVQAFQQEDIVTRSLQDKLWQYLQSDVKPETTMDILGWWGVSQYMLKFGRILMEPVVHLISNFEVGCPRRNRLQPIIFEGLQLLKSVYWNGHILATTQAGIHMEFLRSLDSCSDEDMDSELD